MSIVDEIEEGFRFNERLAHANRLRAEGKMDEFYAYIEEHSKDNKLEKKMKKTRYALQDKASKMYLFPDGAGLWLQGEDVFMSFKTRELVEEYRQDIIDMYEQEDGTLMCEDGDILISNLQIVEV
jgi:hypothetical protein